MRGARRPAIEVQIDGLVLHASQLTPAERERIGSALVRELGRLLGRSPTPALLRESSSLPSMLVRGVRIPSAGVTPERTGASIARAAHHALNVGHSQ